ncbi:MAG: vitamin K epoxide reductase family protein [Janthinobacterium lividum]
MRSKDKTIALVGCGTALATLVAVALFQSELIDSLPDPPGEIFDSERITLSKMAHPAGVPDSYLGLASYGTTFTLLLLAEEYPWAERVLGFKLMADAGAAGFNAVRQVVRFQKLCSWCTGTALATAVMVYGGRKAVTSAFATAKAMV